MALRSKTPTEDLILPAPFRVGDTDDPASNHQHEEEIRMSARIPNRRRWAGLALVVGLGAAGGCLQTRHEIEVKPMHITVDVNVRIQNELKKEFGEQDATMKKISDEEAAAALEKYLKEMGS